MQGQEIRRRWGKWRSIVLHRGVTENVTTWGKILGGERRKVTNTGSASEQSQVFCDLSI